MAKAAIIALCFMLGLSASFPRVRHIDTWMEAGNYRGVFSWCPCVSINQGGDVFCWYLHSDQVTCPPNARDV